MRERYELAERTAKGPLLDEVCEMTGYHRKAVIVELRRPAWPRHRRRGGPRRTAEVVAILRAIRTAAGYPWSVRLKALLPLWLPWARRHVRLTEAVEAQVRRISPRQIDRCLRADRHPAPTAVWPHEARHVTETPDSAADGPLGCAGAGLHRDPDSVAHSGDRADGEFLGIIECHRHSHDLGRTRAVLGKGQFRVRAALDEIRAGVAVPAAGH